MDLGDGELTLEEQRRYAEELGIPFDALNLEPTREDQVVLITPENRKTAPTITVTASISEVA